MVVSEGDLSVVFLPNVGLAWIPCLGMSSHVEDRPLSEGSMET